MPTGQTLNGGKMSKKEVVIGFLGGAALFVTMYFVMCFILSFDDFIGM